MQPRSSLEPGFLHVDHFEDDAEYLSESGGDPMEEVSYVTLDLGTIEPTLLPSSSTYRLIVSHPSNRALLSLITKLGT